MLISLLIGLVVLLGLLPAANVHSALCSHSRDEEREIFTVLAYGDGVFEPALWRASASEELTLTSALWQSDQLSSVAHLQYVHFNCGYTPITMHGFFDKNWFERQFVNYASLTQTAVCYADTVTLREFIGINNNRKYTLRYWIQPINPQRVLTLVLIVPIDDEEVLNDYAARLFPDIVSCEHVE